MDQDDLIIRVINLRIIHFGCLWIELYTRSLHRNGKAVSQMDQKDSCKGELRRSLTHLTRPDIWAVFSDSSDDRSPSVGGKVA